MKKTIAILAALIAMSSQAQDKWGIGLRLGDPTGLSVKKYFQKNALEFNLGRTHWGHSDGWYHHYYHHHGHHHKHHELIAYRGSLPLAMQVHYLFRKNINRIGQENTSGLEWYYGLGGQLRYHSVWYDYRYRPEDEEVWYYERDKRVSDLDLGVDGVIGMEYRFAKAPISLFIDATGFLELVDDPFRLDLMGGLGGRFNF